MSQPRAAIETISDTARWAAIHRAIETKRAEAVFRDPFAERLAGERGWEVARALPQGTRRTWTWTTRTFLFDEFIEQEVAAGVEQVLNLAAGLDARPYRMKLPAGLRWIEVDLPALVDYKERLLADEPPVCELERVRLDLSNVPARQELFAQLSRRAARTLVLTEGLLIYLAPDAVATLARDLAAQPAFQRWIHDICSPGMLRILQKHVGPAISGAGAAFQFGPSEGPDFFRPHGWTPFAVRGLLKNAARIGRLPWLLRPISWLPQPTGRQGRRPWGGVCLQGRS